MKSLHFKLFWRYAILILSIIVMFMVALYYIWGNTLRDNATSELLADCDNISTLLDTKIEQMDDISKRVVNSGQIKSLLGKDLYSTAPEAYRNKKEFSDTLFDIIRLSFDHMELNLFDSSGHYINVGMTSTFKKRTDDLFVLAPWSTSVLDAYGKKVVLATRSPELNECGIPMVSLCRCFAPLNPLKKTAILELQLQYSYLSQKIDSAIHNQKDKKKIYIYDARGNLVYPYNEEISKEARAHIMDTLQMSADNGKEPLPATAKLESKPVLYTHKTSDYTGWTVFVAESEKDLFLSFYQFRTLILAATVLILILTLFITNQIAGSLSAPIQRLEQSASALTLDNLDTFKFESKAYSFQEVESLYHTFEQMKQNLSTSLKETVAAHTKAVDAQMLALQAQMNPHFLYNTLASISILAEDGEDEKAVQMCEDLSQLLRYISSGSDRNVGLKEEVEHTVSYFNLIKVKYEERIRFDLDIDDSLMEIKVPKLIIQPLVENSVKYGLGVVPPWIITVKGYLDNGHWIIKVQDNGSGFSTEFLDTFYQKAALIEEKSEITSLAVGGMGLLNLYTRLHLLYKEQMVFHIENIPGSGASITVGGPLSEKTRR